MLGTLCHCSLPTPFKFCRQSDPLRIAKPTPSQYEAGKRPGRADEVWAGSGVCGRGGEGKRGVAAGSDGIDWHFWM